MTGAPVEPVGQSTLSWASVLANLAREAAAHEHALDTFARGETSDLPEAGPWVAPSGLGPIPVDLHQQALEVLARQLALAERLAEAQTRNRQQQAVADRLDGGYGRNHAPVFFDAAM